MLNLVKLDRHGTTKWELKIICALHLMKRYTAIQALAPHFGSSVNVQVGKMFEGLERFFVDPLKIALYLKCEDLTKQEAKNLMSELGQFNGESIIITLIGFL
jgi:hypothetical protein